MHGHRGLPHAVLTSESVRHVSFLPKQLKVDLFVKTIVKARIPLCAREVRKRCEELACPAEDDEQVLSMNPSKNLLMNLSMKGVMTG